MHKFFLLGFFFLIFLNSYSTKKVKVRPNESPKAQQLSDENQRKFDYFFYEANKEKFLRNFEKSVSYYIECLRIDSTSSVCMYELANIYSSVQQPQKAVELMQKAVHFNPHNSWYLLNLAELYHQVNKSNLSIDIYERLVGLYPENDEYQFTLAQLYAQNSKFDQSLATLDKLEKRIGFNESIILEKMKMYVQQNKEKQSYEEVGKLIKKTPSEVQYHGFLADLYYYFKKYDKAEETYYHILTIDSTYESIYYSLASIKLMQSDTLSFKNFYSKAVQSKNVAIEQKLQKLIPFLLTEENKVPVFNDIELESYFKVIIAQNPLQAQPYILYGNFLRNRLLAQQALDQFHLAIDLDASNEQLWQDILFLDIELNQYDQLLKDGSKAITYFPENGLLSLLYGSGLMQQNRPSEAIDIINRVIPFTTENKSLNGQLYTLLGDAYYKNKNSDSSFIAYEEALKINDSNLSVLNNYSYYLSVEKKELDKAEKMSSRTIELEPGNSTFLDTYAWILFQKKRYLEAKFIIERALDNGGDKNYEIVEHYGDILFFNDDLNHALIQWNKALKLMQSEDEQPAVESMRIEKLIKKIDTKSFID